ncbi:HD domain-containing protein [Gimesia sp.]|uniref:HD domain-containing protein n=1 Tax=Gimesia sp. TaxID=2024833 RepID=UPI003A935F72
MKTDPLSEKIYSLSEMKNIINLLIITVIDEEHDAINSFFEPTGRIVGKKKRLEHKEYYDYSQLQDSSGHEWHIATLFIRKQGSGPAQSMTTLALQSFPKLQWVLLCGIAGGVPEMSFTLGDIYLTNYMHDMTVSSALDGKDSLYRTGGGPIGKHVDFIAKLTENNAFLNNWNSKEILGMDRPQVQLTKTYKNKSFYGVTRWRKEVHKTVSYHFSEEQAKRLPLITAGPAFSGNVLMKDPDLMKKWLDKAKDTYAVEMELSGVYDAISIFGPKVNLLPIRAISDIVGYVRTDDWKKYACKTAASFTWHMVKAGILDPNMKFLFNSMRDKSSETSKYNWASKLSPHIESLQDLSADKFKESIKYFSRLFSCLITTSDALAKAIGFDEKEKEEELCDRLWDFIKSMSAEESLITKCPLFGPPGSGKSSLLSLLALMAQREFENNDKIKVNYINLHECDEVTGQDKDETQTNAVVRMTEMINKLGELKEDETLYLFADGYDKHPRDKVPDFQEKFLHRISQISGIKLFGIGFLDREERAPTQAESGSQEVPVDPDEPENISLIFNSININQSDDFCDRFIDLHTFLNDNMILNVEKYTDLKVNLTKTKLKERVLKVGLHRLDLFRLNIIATANYTKKTNFTSALEAYIRKEIQARILDVSPESEVDVDAKLFLVSQYLYAQDVLSKGGEPKDAELAAKRYRIKFWGLLTGHPIIRTYFHARYVILTLQRIGVEVPERSVTTDSYPVNAVKNAVRKWKLAGLDGKLFNDITNMHCKNIINHLSAQKKEDLYRAIECICDSNDVLTSFDFTHLCYLLGRLDSKDLDAKSLLRRLYDNYFSSLEVFENAFGEKYLTKSEDRLRFNMLQCSLIISLLYRPSSNDDEIKLSKEFLKKMRNKDWCDTISEFHLAYYGDTDFYYKFTSHLSDRKDTLKKKQTLEPYSHTLDALEPRLQDSIRSGSTQHHQLFDIEMATLCALANKRQKRMRNRMEQEKREGDIRENKGVVPDGKIEWTMGHDQSQDKCRERMRILLKEYLEKTDVESNSTNITSRPVTPYARMTQHFIQPEERTTPFIYISKMYELKYDTPRSGWMRKLKLKGRVESVASHTWGTMLLAEVLLPDQPPQILELPDRETYSKDKIIRLLLIHDVAEAFTGDRPSTMPNQSTRSAQEKEFIEELSFLGTLSGISGFQSIVEGWDCVEEASDKSEINGRIANFLDKLEALIQMTIYYKIYSDQAKNTEWRLFYKKLRGDVYRAAGNTRFLTDIIDICSKWTDDEIDLPHDYPHHQDAFKDIKKYYPSIHKQIDLITKNREKVSVWEMPDQKQNEE